jgi:hypothetical protein
MNLNFFNNRNFIIISSIDWSTHHQLHHELVDYLNKKNAKILFIENTGTRNIGFRDISRVSERLKKFFKSWGAFVNLKNSLTIFSPIFIPIHGNWIFDKINSFYIGNKLINWISFINFKKPIVILFVPNPITLSLIKKIDYELLAYYVADDMLLAAKPGSKSIKECEEKIIKQSDIIVYTSKNLRKKFVKKNDESHFLSNGVNIDIFKKNKTKKINKKEFTIGFVGSIRNTIDENLVIFLAKKFPNDRIVFVGPVVDPLKDVIEKKFKNVFFDRTVVHSKIPEVLASFDVGLLPLKINNFTDSIFPVKLYEYLASGIPVLSTASKTIVDFDKENKKSIFVCKTYNDFEKKIKYIKKNSFSNKLINKNLLLARKNSWKMKFAELESILCTKHYSKKEKRISFRNRVLKFYELQKIKFFKFVTYVFIFSLVLLVFISKPTLNKYFEIKPKNKDYENIIVVSGYGHRQYQNIDYQNRVLDLIDYSKKVNIKNIIILGRSSLFDEGKLIIAMLPPKIVKKNIILLKDYGSSYNNILELKNLLNQNEKFSDVKNFLIISDSIFSRRFDLLIKKNIPGVKIDFLKNRLINKQVYFSIVYEILAIIKYKIKNYL